tara:strand:- start:54 stop:1088 length:1035 start_codon:yes stop_codon:yes gene_type:complete
MTKEKRIFTKFTKKSSDIINIKKDFFLNNSKLLKKNLSVISFLKSQPTRMVCKNCNFLLDKKVDYKSHQMEYKICSKCSHLNSKKNDSSEFHNKIYNSNKFSYSNNYMKHFSSRVKNIYIPKVDFLLEFIKKNPVKSLSLLDIGTGSGHFVFACKKRKIKAKGVESNLGMINIGRKFLGKAHLLHVSNFAQSLKLIRNGDYTFVSLVAVLEHLENPNEIFKSFLNSKNKYLFISIPLFSFSVFVEAVFQNVYPRHTAGSHPHLYTYESIKYILKKNKLKICGEWWFGTDFLDINRSMMVSLGKKRSKKFLNKFSETFSKKIDSFQKILDNDKLSSEVHLIIKRV